MAAPLVAVVFDLYDRDNSASVVLRLSSSALVGTIGGQRGQFWPQLDLPVQLGASLSVEQPGQTARATPNGGTIKFGLIDGLMPYLDHVWEGRYFTVSFGDEAAGYDGLSQIYVGRVTKLTRDLVHNQAVVSTSDARVDLDGPLVGDLYPDGAIEPLRGRPRPQVFGRCFSVAPVLEDEPTYLYRISRAAIGEVSAVRVGGVPWDLAISVPGPGEWVADGPAGTLALGGTPLGGELRADAAAPGWESHTTATLLTDIVEAAGGAVDAAGMTALDTAAPYPIGYAAGDPVNRQDVLDEIMTGIGGWWLPLPSGQFTGGVLAPPLGPAVAAYTEINIASCELVEILQPAWRLRVEFRRNWQPASQFYDAVTAAEQAAMRAGGIVSVGWADAAMLAAYPHAVDVPLIRSLVNEEVDAIAIRDRLVAAWTVERRLYDLTVWGDPPPLYSTVSLDYGGVSGLYRVVSALRSIGGGASSVRLWG